ncbi:malto-oligosyltrehalose trehalohydrolase [Roseisolibacter sp. H3M3-2]|uniref:malto-oligosyltrehalose trehalohydrolase n=1 Tax=Roseisolibacter sp. H3M3-2 TaxID=3031323 RepID=UPI0023DB5D07|nr:malto-oligosyltrehalose trehalohydrolase [Roseisolibacter sp. H3M3-2]MDF1504169.1 malto-oligosyltrehalose trehalohydrolase [Roseisolibacter sp. H3M3-2]
MTTATLQLPTWRRLPVGAERAPEGGVHFRVWAPARRRVEVLLESPDGGTPRAVALDSEPDGYHAGHAPDADVGTRYRYRLDGGDAFPDPASRWQPEGPHGPSAVVDPTAFRWSDAGWRGIAPERHVVYELHLGTFTPAGTWAGAAERLGHLVALGVTTLEVLPVAQFPGRFNWGYDGVGLYAPAHQYGTPDDMRAFVDRAHALGLAVILDVVYNHLGPDGNYLAQYAREYFHPTRRTDWGEALNFDGPGSGPVREFFAANAAYWVDEFHLDGLRLDATHAIVDESPRHVLRDVGTRARAAGRGRRVWIVNENEEQRADLVRAPEDGGLGLDAIWNDDWHHSALVALTGRDEAYFSDHRGTAREFVAAARFGFLYQGQWYRWQRQRRGTPALDVAPWRFVHFLENHDQVANVGFGERPRLQSSPPRWRALTALLLLGPQTPMLFQGQEFGSTRRFVYFADHEPELAKLVHEGRFRELRQFPSLALEESQAHLPVPHHPHAFERCVLDWGEAERHPAQTALHRDLLRLRRGDPVLSTPRLGVGTTPGRYEAATLTEHAFLLRWFGEDGDDRLLLVNLDRAAHLDPIPEPLLAPPRGRRWHLRWSSESPAYGGHGTPPVEASESPRTPEPGHKAHWLMENWRLPAESAVLMAAEPSAEGGA